MAAKFKVQGEGDTRDAVDALRKVDDNLKKQNETADKLALAYHDMQAAAQKLGDAEKKLAANTDPSKQFEMEGAVLKAKVALTNQSNAVDKVTAEYKNLNTATEQVEEKTNLLAGTMTEFKAGLDVAGQALGKVKEAFDATVGKALEWDDTIGDLAQRTGAGAKATSELAATFELMGVQTSALESVIKTMNKNGLAVTNENLIRLSREYKSLGTIQEQNTFLMKNFGRAAGDMAEFMGRDEESIKRLTEAAKMSGKVIGDDMADSADHLNEEMAIMKQRVDGLAITVGNALIPAINNFIDSENAATQRVLANYGAVKKSEEASTELETATATLTSSFESLTTSTKDSANATAIKAGQDRIAKEAAQELNQAASDLATTIAGPLGKETESYTKQQAELRLKMIDAQKEIDKLTASNGTVVTTTEEASVSQAKYEQAVQKAAEAAQKLAENTDPKKTLDLTVAAEDAAKKVETLGGKMGGTTQATIDNSKAIDEQKKKLEDLQKAMDENAKAHEEATARIVFGFLQQRLAADGLQGGELTMLAEVGKAWGIYDEKTATALGAVDTALATSGTNAQTFLATVKGAIDGLPTYKSFTYEIKTINPAAGDIGIGPTSNYVAPTKETKPSKGGFQHGGSFIVPGMGSGDRPYMINAEPGEMVTITPKSQVSNRTWNVNIYNQGNDVTPALGRAKALAGSY